MKTFCLCKKKEGNSTYHIFECKLVTDECIWSNNHDSKCDKINNSNTICELPCNTEKDMRLDIAKLANQGLDICGVCVSTLYKNQSR